MEGIRAGVGVIFIFGLIVGSFLSIYLCYIQERKTFPAILPRCVNCGGNLHWYHFVPVFSWFFPGGVRCKCGKKISIWYPLIQVGNALLWAVTFIICGFHLHTILYCLTISVLFVLSLIDARTFEIPFSCNIFIGALGIAATIFDVGKFWDHIAGFVCVSVLLLLVYFLTHGAGIGGGDIKLMAATGLLLGFRDNFIGFFFGCLYGCVIHLVRMRFFGGKSRFAMGPYLAVGLLTAIWFGDKITDWYLCFIGL